MIKLVAAAVWIAAATAGSVFYAFQQAGEVEAAAPATEAGAFGGLDYVRLNVVSVPQLKNGEVEGYFLARLVFTAPAERLKKLVIPADAMLTDAVYTKLYADPSVDFSQVEALDVDAFRAGLRDAVNAKIGEDLIAEVLIEQVDFLSKADIRRASFRGWDSAAAAQSAPKKADGGGH
ncbi:hypothetical protein PZ895_18140 [Mesorhizobium sp. YIM 152430]|uniref:hypothetical protein n=1 Tax=Mesorhizobium sp. YIM 152430 TaxID=3031761 RepID=UPI0023DC0874|nr:hypothetical protein [Mesorhizobium sp. YIM 152430]MDF1601681.1 hypothetical protein [Mesorhizobium sp. YIM 152430]